MGEGDGPPLTALRALVAAAGVAGRGPRTVVRLLTEAPYDLAGLVRESGVERRCRLGYAAGQPAGPASASSHGTARVAVLNVLRRVRTTALQL